MDNSVKVSQLFIYPLKSGHEVPLTESRVKPTGLLYDRIVMIIRKKNKSFVTIRTHPEMYDIQTTVENEEKGLLNMKLPGSEKVFRIDTQVPRSDESKVINTQVWNIPTDVLPYETPGDELDKQLSELIKEEVTLVLPYREREIKAHPEVAMFKNFKETDATNFADAAPILVTSVESLDYVNKLLAEKNHKPLDMINFRPNIVLQGGPKPFWEDTISAVKIGDLTLRRFKPCVRCKITTYDTRTKNFNKSKEPLNLLADINFNENFEGVIFGQNFAVDLQDGDPSPTIRQGDDVFLKA